VILFRSIRNIFAIPELVRKLMFTLGAFVVFRLGSLIPIVGINTVMLSQHMTQSGLFTKGFLGYLNVFSGGSLQSATLFAFGISPYITASIMMNLLTMSIPWLEELQKEGEFGRRQINQYTRYLAIALSLFWGSMYVGYLEMQGLALSPGFGFRALFLISITVGTLVVMWLADQISIHGIGNGSSMIIFAGIVARFPVYIGKTIAMVQHGEMSIIIALAALAMFIALAMCVIFLEKGERKVPVQYARRIVGNRVYGGQSSYIPFKINVAGVMPVIFAAQVMSVPTMLAKLLSYLTASWSGLGFLDAITNSPSFVYIAQFGLIVFFSFFYTALVFNPTELSQNIKKSGGFIPGIRPGKQTAAFFDYLLNRIGLVGALYLATLAILPDIVSRWMYLPFHFGGTSLLIMVGVALEVSSQIESYLIEHRYEGFLSSGRLKKRR
jgi:preprotein translocase subunit SecY